MDKINPKRLPGGKSLGDSGFLQFFRVVSSDDKANPVTHLHFRKLGIFTWTGRWSGRRCGGADSKRCAKMCGRETQAMRNMFESAAKNGTAPWSHTHTFLAFMYIYIFILKWYTQYIYNYIYYIGAYIYIYFFLFSGACLESSSS